VTDLHLDTHVALWLYLGEHDRIPSGLRERLGADALRVSPMVRLELVYLHEIGRLVPPAHRVLDELAHAIGLVEESMAFGAVVKAAETLTWTRDPFDRMIAAHALVSFATLATSDEKIRKALGPYAVWE
jgi:PIN domain nuclease of toxin-antitoxin system